MIRFYLTCIFLCAPFFTKAQTTAKADSLFRQRQYLLARVAYERLLFDGGQDNNSLLLKKSYCLKAEGKFEEAYNTLQRADFFQGTDSLKFSLYYESALTAHLAGKYDLSINKIRELQYYFPNLPYPMIDLIEILNLNYQHKLTEANEKFVTFKTKYGLTDAANIYEKKKFRKLKDPQKAESISHFLPGVGQMYAGYTGRGLTSGLIQTGLLGFTAISFINGYYFSGAFTGVGLFSMFNNGGARHAQYLAEKRNAMVINELNSEVKRVAAKVIKK